MADSSQIEQVRERVKRILRRDLKLGEVEIADDMPFLSNETDLDSLDILLLVTSIEREFGFKVASEEVGRSAFQNVDTLTRFILERSAQKPPTSAGDALQRLPHREPFRFVTRITNLQAGNSAEGVWALTGSEAFFAGHFPGRPIVPGVLIAEALAQLSGLIAPPQGAAGGQGKLAHVDVRFEQSAVPPVEVLLQSKLIRQMGQLQQFEVSAMAGATVLARGTLALHLAAGDQASEAK